MWQMAGMERAFQANGRKFSQLIEYTVDWKKYFARAFFKG
jgi:hypothetical protein